MEEEGDLPLPRLRGVAVLHAKCQRGALIWIHSQRLYLLASSRVPMSCRSQGGSDSYDI